MRSGATRDRCRGAFRRAPIGHRHHLRGAGRSPPLAAFAGAADGPRVRGGGRRRRFVRRDRAHDRGAAWGAAFCVAPCPAGEARFPSGSRAESRRRREPGQLSRLCRRRLFRAAGFRGVAQKTCASGPFRLRQAELVDALRVPATAVGRARRGALALVRPRSRRALRAAPGIRAVARRKLASSQERRLARRAELQSRRPARRFRYRQRLRQPLRGPWAGGFRSRRAPVAQRRAPETRESLQPGLASVARTRGGLAGVAQSPPVPGAAAGGGGGCAPSTGWRRSRSRRASGRRTARPFRSPDRRRRRARFQLRVTSARSATVRARSRKSR